jgi:hypothetical protein
VTITAGSVKDTTKTAASVITVNPNPTITVTGGAPVAAKVGVAYSVSLGSGGTAPFTWQITAGKLPGGLSLNASANTGAPVITGTPTAAGTFNFTIKLTDSAAGTAGPVSVSQQLTIVVNSAPLVVNTTSLPNGVVNTNYSEPLQASGGTAPYAWSVASGSTLPSWLSISGSGTSWTIAGTPTATGTFTFSLTVTDSSSPSEQSVTQALSVTVNTAAAACGSGHESVLAGQYTFSLSGFNSSGYLAALGSFTADGNGNITAGVVDSKGASGVTSGNITVSGSSYSVGADNRGCATIVTPTYTFTARFALETTPSGASPVGTLEEWEAGTNPYIASGQILKQTVPTAITNGTYVYQQTGVYSSSQYRTGVVGTMTASGGSITAGEYDSNVVGDHHTYTGVTGTYASPDPTTGRFTDATTLEGITAHRVLYAVSSSQFLEMTTESLSSFPVLIGKGQLQSGSLTISGNLVYYATGRDSSGGVAQFARVSITGSSTATASLYEDDAGTWLTPTPTAMTCSYAIDSYGKVETSGSGCGSYPPVFYLTGPNQAFTIGTDPDVFLGQIAPQTATKIAAATYFFGTQEVVNLQADLMTEVGAATVSSTGVVGGHSDQTSASLPQQGDQTVSDTLTVNSDGTFSDSKHPGQVSGIVISGNQLVIVDSAGSAYPTILVIDTVPTT